MLVKVSIIIDLPNNLEFLVKLFADDASLFVEFTFC